MTYNKQNKKTITIEININGVLDMEKFELLREYTRLIERKLEMLNEGECCSCNITTAQCHALVEVGRRKDISLKELAEILELNKSTMSKTVEDLYKKRLISREPLETDRRAIKINLTEEGMRHFEMIEAAMNRKFSEIFDRIPAGKQDNVLDALNLYIDSLNK